MVFFFIMRDGINPIWEDENNLNGGIFSFKVPKSNISEIWEKVIILLIGEVLIEKNNIINGVSLHPKYNCFILKVWSKINYNKLEFTTNIDKLDMNGYIYKKNNSQEKSK